MPHRCRADPRHREARSHLRRELDGRGEKVHNANPANVIGPNSNHAPKPYFWVWISVNGSLPSAPNVSGEGSVDPIGIPHGFAPPPEELSAPPLLIEPSPLADFESAVPLGADTGNPSKAPVIWLAPDAWVGSIGNFTSPIAGSRRARQLEAQIRINPVNFIRTYFLRALKPMESLPHQLSTVDAAIPCSHSL